MRRWMWVLCVLPLTSWASGNEFEALTQSDAWKPLADRKSEHGAIEVYLAHLGKVPCIRADVKLPVTPEWLMDVVTDVEAALDWQDASLVESERIPSTEGSFTWFQRADLPAWTLLNDRMWFLTASVTESAQSTRVSWRPAQSPEADAFRKTKGAANDKAVEPPVNYGQWTMSPTSEGLEGRYEICVDAGGAIPLSVQRFVTMRTLPDTMEKMVQEVRRREAAGRSPQRRW